MVWIQLFLIQLRIWFCTASYFIGWRIAVCVWLWKQTNSSLKWTSVVVASPYFLQGGRFSRATVINGRLKELSVTMLNRGNSSTRSLKTPVVTLFGHFGFTCEEPGTVQKRIELWARVQVLVLAVARLSRELGKNSPPSTPPKPSCLAI